MDPVETKPISYAGFSVLVPTDWDVGAIRLEQGMTMLGIQDAEKNRIEVRWEKAGLKKARQEARRKGKPMEKRLLRPDEVSEKFHQEAKKKIKGLDVQEGVAEEKIGGHTAAISSWSDSQGSGYDAVWFCGNTDRYYYLHFVGAEEQFKSIIKGITCHTSLPYYRWQYLGLNLSLPKDFELVSQKAEVGRLIAVFRGYWEPQKKKGPSSFLRPAPLPEPRRLLVERYNLTRLSDADPAPWARKEINSLGHKYLGGIKFEKREEDQAVNGHRASALLFSQGGGLFRKPSAFYLACSWTCPESNSAYLLVVPLKPHHDYRQDEKLPTCPQYVSCHWAAAESSLNPAVQDHEGSGPEKGSEQQHKSS